MVKMSVGVQNDSYILNPEAQACDGMQKRCLGCGISCVQDDQPLLRIQKIGSRILVSYKIEIPAMRKGSTRYSLIYIA